MAKIFSLKKKKSILDQFYLFAKQQNPNPKCELYYKTSYQLLVSVVLSAQTTDKMVNRCMKPHYDCVFDPDFVLSAGYDKILSMIRSIGLAPTKAKNIINLTKQIKTTHKGKVPNTRKDLEALPGVGRKTANVILAEVFGQPTLAVDTHVYRVTRRLGLQGATTPEKAEKELIDWIPSKYLPKLHHWLILHGRYTCKARRPLCSQCFLYDLCESKEKH